MAKTIARPSKSQYRKGYVSKAKDASPTRTANSGNFPKKTRGFGEIGGFDIFEGFVTAPQTFFSLS